MKWNKNFFSIVVFIIVLCSGGFTIVKADSNLEYHKEFNVRPGQTLFLKLKTGCDINIVGGDQELLIADVEINDCSEEKIRVDFHVLEKGVMIETKYLGGDDHSGCNGSVKVTLPNKFNIDFETMGGDITLSDLDGTMEGSTMGGSLDLTRLTGKINLSTMGGEIKLLDSDVDGELSTMGGDVSVRNVVGNLNASSMGGDVIQENVRGRSEPSGSNEINWTTMGGDIDIDEAPNGARVKTLGGDITVKKASRFIKAETMGGDIVINEVDGWVKASTMGGEIKVRIENILTQEDKSIRLSSMGGDVYLYVPEDFSMEVDIEIKFDRDRKKKAEIESDFNLTEEVKDYDDSSWGDDVTVLRGYGTFNGGENKVAISTVNSKVYLIKK